MLDAPAGYHEALSPAKGSQSSRRSKLALAALAAGLLVLIYIAIGRSGAAFRRRNAPEDYNDEEVCKTPECLEVARFLLARVDNKTRPCDDFYQFACGKWDATLVIEDNKREKTTFSEAEDELRGQLRQLLETREPAGREAKFVGNLRNFYASCMDTQKLDALGSRPLLELIERLGGYPVLNNWQQADFDWSKQLVKLRQLGIGDALIKVWVSPDAADNARNLIMLSQADFGVGDREHFLRGREDPLIEFYYQLLVKSARLLGAGEAEARAQMLAVLEFEMELAHEWELPAGRVTLNPLAEWYNKMSLLELQKLAPHTRWPELLSALVGVALEPSVQVVAMDPANLWHIDRLLRLTDPKITANYLMSRLVLKSMKYLDAGWREQGHALALAGTGARGAELRWRTCVELARADPFNVALSALYVRSSFRPEQRDHARLLVGQVREQFKRQLEQADWLDAATRAKALAKAAAMLDFVGYPDELLDEAALEGLYEPLGELKPDELFENALRARKYSLDYEYARLFEANNRSDWRWHANVAVINAFHEEMTNSIDLPAAFLQVPYFGARYPAYVNFAVTGGTIGHETAHGFDSSGRLHDETGRLADWWTPEASAAFKKRADCFVSQYDNFTLPELELKVRGGLTLGENIADSGGIRAAFGAYRKHRRETRGDPGRLPGLERLSEEQLFWVSLASVSCGKLRPEYQTQTLANDAHAPERFRINGPASNSEEFAEVFECELGSPMNPASKCSVW